MEILKNVKLQVLALFIVVVCELNGTIRFSVGMINLVVFPMLFAMVIGGCISYPKFKILKNEDMKNASHMLMVVLILMVATLALKVGPRIPEVAQVGVAILLQEFGHFIGTILFGLPLAMLLGMKREAIGATYSLDREPNIAIIAEKYGFNSPEGHGVMAMYICGTLFGALWIGVFASIIASLNIFHPFALAMGSGIGSGSMLASASGVISDFYPEFKEQILAYAGASNLVVTIFGVYFSLFISLPVCERAYTFLDKFRRKPGKSAIDIESVDNLNNSERKV